MKIDDEFYDTDEAQGEAWRMILADSCEELPKMESDSVDLSVHSPPFDSLFTYSPSVRDMGNSPDRETFHRHYGFVVRELLRLTKPGRMACVHVMDVPTTKATHGVVGLTDFSAEVVRDYQEAGWIFVNRITIRKNPQCLKDGTRVLTPTGWTTVESIRPGDRVIGSDGTAIKVADVPFRGEQPVYRVTFDDGASVECGPEHLWTVRTSKVNAWKTVRTDELADMGSRTPGGGWRHQVPVVPAVQFDPGSDLPIHPRLLGALLADGSWAGQRSVTITKDHELIRDLPLPADCIAVYRPGSDRALGRTATYGITDSIKGNRTLSALREMGLGECRAWEKFVPAPYLVADVASRRELLRGLLDGDGKIQGQGGIYYLTTSARLAADVVHLVNSLGGLATARVQPGSRYGEDQQGRPIWTVSIRMNGDWCPFTLERKARRWSPDRRAVHRNITSVEATGTYAPCTCITVAADDGLFVTEGFVVTHNSAATRTKSHGLAFATLRRDRSQTRPVYPDYLLLFRKPGQNAVPITAPLSNSGDPRVDNDLWIRWAEAIWDDIRETNTLNVAVAREDADERHLCPLSLDLIERCVKLWSNPGEHVLSPCGGIGSEGFVAVQLGRRYTGVELKRSYWTTAVANLRRAEDSVNAPSLFDLHPAGA